MKNNQTRDSRSSPPNERKRKNENKIKILQFSIFRYLNTNTTGHTPDKNMYKSFGAFRSYKLKIYFRTLIDLTGQSSNKESHGGVQ